MQPAVFRGVSRLVLAMACAGVGTASRASAQCDPSWSAGDAVPGVDGTVNAVVHWDPDGIGPRPTLLIAAGKFTIAGRAECNNIAAWDPDTRRWSPLGSGTDGEVFALAVLPNGQLVVAGTFLNAGGVATRRIGLWDGFQWHKLTGGGLGGNFYGPIIYALAVLPNGTLIVGGDFDVKGNNIVAWDGAAWSKLGNGLTGVTLANSVRALAVLPNGDLVAGGEFENAGEVAATAIARWDGVEWHSMGVLHKVDATVRVLSLSVRPDGGVVAAGDFDTADDISTGSVALWDGAGWSPFAGGLSGEVRATIALSDGSLLAAPTEFLPDGTTVDRIFLWNGLEWAEFGDEFSSGINVFAPTPDGGLVAAGRFTTAAGVPASHVAHFSGNSWHSYGTGTNDSIFALATLSNGLVAAGGDFTSVGGVAARHVAVLEPQTWQWSALGSGTNDTVSCLAVLSDGRIAAGGRFTIAGGTPANHVAVWDGAAWSPLGDGTDGPVQALAVLPGGDLVAGGYFLKAGGAVVRSVARWDGAAWHPLGQGMVEWSADPLGNVNGLAVLQNGTLVATGSFNTAGNALSVNLALWNGVEWITFGGLSDPAAAVTVMPNGDVIVGGLFGYAGTVTTPNIARWNGSWSALGPGTSSTVFSVLGLPGGDVLAGGFFTAVPGTPGLNRIARWNGATWSALGPGLNKSVFALAHLGNGDILAAGMLTSAAGVVASGVARYGAGAVPVVTVQPDAATACRTGALFSVVAEGSGPLTYQWRKNGAPLANGTHIIGATTPSLAIVGLTGADNGDYDCVVTNPCGSAQSDAAPLVVCISDQDCSSFVNGIDFDLYAGAFEAGDRAADVNGDGSVSGPDFDAYTEAFIAGC